MNLERVPPWAWGVGAAVAVAVMASTVKRVRVPMPGRAIRALLVDIFPRAGIPEWYALTNAALESGFQSDLHLRRGRDDSYGLMMVNNLVPDVRTALENAGLSVDDLFDPRTNAEFWADNLAGVFRRGAVSRGFTGDRLWEAVRLRLAGIEWDSFDSAKAAAIKARLWRYAARFR